MADVESLAKPVSITATKISLAELVQRIAAETGAALRASPEVADEPLALVIKEMPARSLLEQVADLLGYRWSRRGQKGSIHCEVWQDLASRRREEDLRKASLVDVEKRFRDEIRQTVAMAALSQEAIERVLADAAQQKREGQPIGREEWQRRASSGEERERHRRLAIAQRLWSPITRALASLIGQLRPAQWAELRHRGEIVLSTHPEQGEARLPSDIARVFYASQPLMFPPGVRAGTNDPEMEQRLREREQEMRREWSAATGFQVVMQFTDEPDDRGVAGALKLTACAWPLRSGSQSKPTFFGGGMGNLLALQASPVDPRRRLEENAAQRSIELEKDPLLGQRKSFIPKARPGAGSTPYAYGSAWLFRELMPEIAKAYDIQFLSDAYWNVSPIVLAGFSADVSQPLFRLLDRLAGPSHHWDRRGNLIRLRSRTWFFDRPREVPLRLVRKWREEYEKRGALTLDDYVQMGTTLNDSQLRSLESLVAEAGIPQDPYEQDFHAVWPARHALRLYSCLTAAQQDALWRGTVLPVWRMTARQRTHVSELLREKQKYRIGRATSAEIARAQLSLTVEQLVRLSARHSGSTRLFTEPHAASRRDTGEQTLRQEIAASESDLRHDLDAPGTVPKRHSVSKLWFHLVLPTGRRESFHLVVASRN